MTETSFGNLLKPFAARYRRVQSDHGCDCVWLCSAAQRVTVWLQQVVCGGDSDSENRFYAFNQIVNIVIYAGNVDPARTHQIDTVLLDQVLDLVFVDSRNENMPFSCSMKLKSRSNSGARESCDQKRAGC